MIEKNYGDEDALQFLEHAEDNGRLWVHELNQRQVQYSPVAKLTISREEYRRTFCWWRVSQ